MNFRGMQRILQGGFTDVSDMFHGQIIRSVEGVYKKNFNMVRYRVSGTGLKKGGFKDPLNSGVEA